jgi:hypothetical protein
MSIFSLGDANTNEYPPPEERKQKLESGMGEIRSFMGGIEQLAGNPEASTEG